LLGVHVECRDELHVAHVVGAELHVHQARYPAPRIGVLVVLHPLDEGTCAVTHTHDGYSYRTHEDCSCSLPAAPRGAAPACQLAVVPADVSLSPGGGDCRPGSSPACRSDAISSLSQRTSRSTDSSPCLCSS